MIRLIQGEALRSLRELPAASVDALVTDPPYSSGGLTRGDRMAPASSKYCQDGDGLGRPDFEGDNRDQRGWLAWCGLWLAECRRVVKPGGYALMFSDWRQLPQATDALQCGGFVWRGLVAWDKTEGARAPHTGYFRHQCEYVAWGTAGPCPKADGRGPFPGCIRVPVRQADKHHQTGKPTELMRRLLRCVPPGGVVLDPFMGSGTTGLAAAELGLSFLGIELTAENFAVAEARILAPNSA